MSALSLTEKPTSPSKVILTADEAARIVENFIADHLGNLALAGVPRRIVFPIRVLWAVPIAVAYPKYGLAGVIGIAAVDDELANIIAVTPIEDMQQAAKELYAEQKIEIEAALN